MTIDRIRKAASKLASSARRAARTRRDGAGSAAPVEAWSAAGGGGAGGGQTGTASAQAVEAFRAATSAVPFALDAGAVDASRRAHRRAAEAAGASAAQPLRGRTSGRSGQRKRGAAPHAAAAAGLEASAQAPIYVPEDFDPDFVRAPSMLLMALEWRASFEFGATLASLPWLARAATGDGHPVLVFPGLIAGDITTAALRAYLKTRGYDVHGWQQGVNLGPRPGVLEACVQRVRQLADRSGRCVSLVGWSLGGVYAREIAKEVPREVRCVITLGSPFTGHPRATNAWRVYAVAAGHHAHRHPRRASLSTPPPRPTTSIYSRTDGVVAWQCSLNPKTAHTENIEVVASHLGLGMNPAAMYAIADRLAQPEGAWQPFHRQGWRSLVYPAPQWP